MEVVDLDTGSTAWLLIATGIVLLMTPGLAFFYAGMVRSKNVLAMLMQNFICMGVVSVLWVVGVYSLAFSTDAFGGLVGDFGAFGLSGQLGGESTPTMVFIAFQMTFAIITPALISGALADRMKFGPWIAFVAIWVTVVYAPIAHWVWAADGWLFEQGALDFAGGTVVHINAGIAALALVLVLGKRSGWPKEQMRPHNLPMVMLGAALLWFGWLGFNAGSALAANGIAATAVVNTIVAAGAAMLAWLATEKVRDGHATTLGAASGVVAGLVAITPAAGFVTPMGSIAIGLVAGVICALFVSLKYKLGYDDSLDVIAVHLVGGVIGSILVAFFASPEVNEAGTGLFYGGDIGVLTTQLVAVGATLAYSFIATLIIGFAIHKSVGMRVEQDVELAGLDTAVHAESGYEFGSALGGSRGAGVTGARVSQEVDA